MTERQKPTSGPKWLMLHAAEIIGRREMRDPAQRIALNPETHAEAIRMPYLFPNDERGEKSSAPKFDLYTGALLIPSWISRQDKLTGQKWSKYASVEFAMRGCVHILTRYNPGSELVRNAMRLMEYTDDLERRFQRGEITEENLQSTIDESYEVLYETGFIKAIKPVKRDTRDQILRSIGPDSLGRFPNQLISRTQLASAYIKVLSELLYTGKVTKKYERLFIQLTTERMLERLFLENVIDRVRIAYPRMNSRDTAEEELADIRKLCAEVLTPETVRVSPYRKPALLFSAGVFGLDPSIFDYRTRYEKRTTNKLFYSVLEHDEAAIERLRHDIRLPTQALVRSDQITDDEAVMAVSDRLNKYEEGLATSLREGDEWERSSCIIN